MLQATVMEELMEDMDGCQGGDPQLRSLQGSEDVMNLEDDEGEDVLLHWSEELQVQHPFGTHWDKLAGMESSWNMPMVRMAKYGRLGEVTQWWMFAGALFSDAVYFMLTSPLQLVARVWRSR